jgi:hypothetical protein
MAVTARPIGTFVPVDAAPNIRTAGRRPAAAPAQAADDARPAPVVGGLAHHPGVRPQSVGVGFPDVDHETALDFEIPDNQPLRVRRPQDARDLFLKLYEELPGYKLALCAAGGRFPGRVEFVERAELVAALQRAQG